MKKPVYTGDKIKITNDTPLGRTAVVSIGDVAIPFYKIEIDMSLDDFMTAKITVPIERIDVEALLAQTEVSLVRQEDEQI